MDPLVCSGAMAQCLMGVAPAPLTFLPTAPLIATMPAGTIMDAIPIVNITPFGMCKSPTNPAVMTATAAAFGTPTPVPCTPVPVGTWLPGSPSLILGVSPALTMTCKLACSMGGMISIISPGQTEVLC